MMRLAIAIVLTAFISAASVAADRPSAGSPKRQGPSLLDLQQAWRAARVAAVVDSRRAYYNAYNAYVDARDAWLNATDAARVSGWNNPDLNAAVALLRAKADEAASALDAAIAARRAAGEALRAAEAAYLAAVREPVGPEAAAGGNPGGGPGSPPPLPEESVAGDTGVFIQGRDKDYIIKNIDGVFEDILDCAAGC